MPARSSRIWIPSSSKRKPQSAEARVRKAEHEKTQAEAKIVGIATAVLATDYAKLITGETVYVDGGYHILG